MNVIVGGAAVGQVPDWSALPAGVLQRILRLGNIWQVPGSCLAAPVCSTWRSAAAGCSGTRLLYNAGNDASDKSFIAWIGRSSPQLVSLILSSSKVSATEQVLGALAQAAMAAAAAARPLPLHTLRVLGQGIDPKTAGMLVAGLPNLVSLQLPELVTEQVWKPPSATAVQQHLGPLQQATNLQELHLRTTYQQADYNEAMAGLLPPSLQRLSWHAYYDNHIPVLSHAGHLTCLQLLGWRSSSLAAGKLPAGLQELDMTHASVPYVMGQEGLEQQQLATGFRLRRATFLQHLSGMPKLRALSMAAEYVSGDAHATAAAQLTSVTALTVSLDRVGITARSAIVQGGLFTAASIPGLRRLDITLTLGMPAMTGLSQLTGLRQLSVWFHCDTGKEERRAWTKDLGCMPNLKWLAVPDAVLLVPDRSWLGGLTQLQVLQVMANNEPEKIEVASSNGAWRTSTDRADKWLNKGSLRAVPRQLRVLLVTGVTAEQAASLHLRRRLQQQLRRSRGCELVVAVADPTKQLVGLPEALQQALA